MTLLQALAYFFREAALNLLRGWKVGLLVAVTIGVSLFVGGLFLLLSAGVARSVEAWRGETRVVAYLAVETGEEVARSIAEEVGRTPWVASVELVSSDEARRRFDDAFPGLSELLETDEPLASSLELALRETAPDPAVLETWVEELRSRPEIAMVDDDRQWLRQVELFAALLGAVGYGLGGLLLIAAVLTTASVIRLTAHVYRQEITVLRLANGEGCVRLLRHDVERGALLIERLGEALVDLGWPLEVQHDALCRAAARLWRPAPDCGLMPTVLV